MSQKRIETLVYTGNVLDERGNWVPLPEKIREERLFLKHLENGEVFYSGVWVHISSLLRSIRRDQATPVNAKETIDTEFPVDAPEETIAIPMERVSGYLNKIAAVTETDFPPETAELKIESSEEQPPADEAEFTRESDDCFFFEGKTHVDLSIINLQTISIEGSDVIDHGTEFEETVQFNIKSIRDEKNKNNSDTTKKQGL